MTNPSTDELRSWARENGVEVADRGRLSPKVLKAWQAAHEPDRATDAPAAESAAAGGASRSANGKPKASKSAKRPAPAEAEVAATRPAAGADDDVIVDLRDEVASLRERLDALESRLAAPPRRRFLRSRV